MATTLLALAVAVLLSAVGHILLSKGMRPAGEAAVVSAAAQPSEPAAAPTGLPAVVIAKIQRALKVVWTGICSPWVIIGVALQAVFFGTYLWCLSRADLSLVLPLTAFDFVLITLLARGFLGETVSVTRWIGVILISLGVFLVGGGDRLLSGIFSRS